MKITLEHMMYILWCNEYEQKPLSCESYDTYRKFMNLDSKEHYGDCTSDCNSCLRCERVRLEIKAQNAINYLNHEEQNPTWKKILNLKSKREK